MQVGTTTSAVETAISAYSSQQVSEGSEAEAVAETDRYEPSQAVMGAAENLPGQGAEKSGFQVDGSFGFCENCGTSHDASGKSDGAAPKVDGVEIPDLHTLGEEEAIAAVGGEGDEVGVAAENASEEEVGVGAESVERDSLTGDAELTDEEQKEVEELKRRDQEVRTHEHAHVAAGGQYIRGGIQYEYQTGPDGKRYAVGGEVSIDTSPESDPEDTIRKAQTIRQAALAPAEPSGQDRRAAAAAAQMEMKARQELMEEKLEGDGEGDGGVGEVDDILAGAGAGETNGDHGLGDGADDSGLNGDEASVPKMDEAPGIHAEHSAGAAISAEGLDVGETDNEDHLTVAPRDGDGLGVEEDEEDEGLPEISAASATPPITQLEYGQQREAGQLVDMFG